jgi:hypothetical protein
MRMRAQTQDSSLDRAEEYLKRIAQLTGAKRTPEGYRLRAGRRDFLVGCKFVRVISYHRLAFPWGQTQMCPAQK